MKSRKIRRKQFGFNISNETFAENSWYFRNALVRANYNDWQNGIHETTKFLEMFFENLLMSAGKMPFTTQLAQDLASKRAICRLSAKAFVVAHKAILTDVRELAEANTTRLLEKVEDILSSLRGTPTGGEWLVSYCEEKGWNFRSERSFSILEFGFNSAVTYLEETGRITSRRVNGNRRYKRCLK